MTSLVLLTNGTGTGAEATWPGGVGIFMVAGALQSGAVKLQFLAPDGTTWSELGTKTNVAAAGAVRFELPAGVKIRAVCEKFPVGGTVPTSVTAVAATLTDAAAAAAAGPDRELAVVTYLVKTAFTGAAVGDTVTLTQVLNLSGNTPVTEAVLWRNQSTAQDLAGAPSAASLTISGQGALTNAEVRATPLVVSALALGDPADAAATSDTGAFALGALFKRFLSVKLPASLGLKASAGSLPVVIASDDAQIGTKVTAIAALDTGGSGLIGWLSQIWFALRTQLPATLGMKASAASLAVVLASDDAQIGTKPTASTGLGAGGAGLIGWLATIRDVLLGTPTVNTLAQPGVARQLAAGSATANTVLTATCRRVSMIARTSDVRYMIGAAAQTAAATSHLIIVGERLDLSVPANAQIAVIQAGTTAGTLELTELVTPA